MFFLLVCLYASRACLLLREPEEGFRYPRTAMSVLEMEASALNL